MSRISMRKLCRSAVALGALYAVACSSEERPPAEPAPAAPAPAAQTAASEPAAAELEPTPEELPVEEDFEGEAEGQISADNFRAELDALEKEIDAEK